MPSGSAAAASAEPPPLLLLQQRLAGLGLRDLRARRRRGASAAAPLDPPGEPGAGEAGEGDAELGEEEALLAEDEDEEELLLLPSSSSPPQALLPLGSALLSPPLDAGEGAMAALLGEQPALLRRKSVNTTECVAVPSSEHVAEIVGRQGEWGTRGVALKPGWGSLLLGWELALA